MSGILTAIRNRAGMAAVGGAGTAGAAHVFDWVPLVQQATIVLSLGLCLLWAYQGFQKVGANRAKRAEEKERHEAEMRALNAAAKKEETIVEMLTDDDPDNDAAAMKAARK